MTKVVVIIVIILIIVIVVTVIMMSNSRPVALIAQWFEGELRRRRSCVQVLPCASEWVIGQSTQSLWRIPCPPPEQKLSEFLLERPSGSKKKKK